MLPLDGGMMLSLARLAPSARITWPLRLGVAPSGVSTSASARSSPRSRALFAVDDLEQGRRHQSGYDGHQHQHCEQRRPNDAALQADIDNDKRRQLRAFISAPKPSPRSARWP
jgi:hypothetical protein